jgi:nucleoside-diphosphate-sugar epimerase
MRCVVIGATGHIGTWLIPRLVTAGHEVIGVSRARRAPYRESPAWSSVRRVTLQREDPAFADTIAAWRPDVVVDFICFDLPSARQLVEALPRVALFLHCGTLWVHGVPTSVPYDESAERFPFGEYGIRKAEIERYLLDQAISGFPAAVLHPGHITGPGWRPINPAGNLNLDVFARLARGDRVVLPDDGCARLQHVHADDVARAFECAIQSPEKAAGHAFHVAASEPVSMREYAQAVAGWFGSTARLEYLPLRDWERQADPEDARVTRDHVLHSPWALVDKARDRLGFRPRYGALEAVREAVEALKGELPG